MATVVVPARAISINDQTAADAGGIANYYDRANQFPAVAAIMVNGASNCTGSLINSRTILTAAHCFYGPGGFDGGPTPTNPGNPVLTVSFGPIATTNNAANNDRTVTSVVTHAQYGAGGQAEINDIAVISLSAPVTTIKPVKLFTAGMTEPGVGTTITMVGYGGNGTGSNCCNPIDNKRRVALSSLAGLMPRNEEEPGSTVTQPFYYAQFRNPLSPNSPNKFGLTVPVTSLEGATVGGDSGGPLFATINGQMVQIGELRGGDNPVGRASEYGDVNDWTPLSLYTQWLALNDPQRAVSAKSGNFNWSNADAWVDSVPGIVSGTPDNTAGNVTNYQTDVAHYYNVTLSNPGTVTLDMNATVDSVVINGAQSMLTLPTGFTLTTEVGTGISDGTLLMTGGTLAAPNVLLTGGLLTGNGTITGTAAFGNTTNLINNGGMIAPFGNLTVEGKFTQTAGTAQFRGFASGASDLLTVTGAAALGGNLVTAIQPGLYGNATSLHLIDAGSLTGSFGSVLSTSAFLTPTATYTNNGVDVTLTRVGFGAVAGQSANQRNIGNALEAGYSTSLTGAPAALYASLLSGQMNLTQLNGEVGASSAQASFVATTQFMTAIMDAAFDNTTSGGPASSFAAAGDGMAYAAAKRPAGRAAEAYAAVTPRDRRPQTFDARWAAWGTVYGGYSRTDGDASVGSNRTDSRVWGVVSGAEYRATPDTRVGFAVGGGGSSFGVDRGLGSGRADMFQLALYAKHDIGAAYLAGAVSYAWQDVTTERTVAGSNTLRADFDAHTFAARLEGGWRFATPVVGITPYAAVQTTTYFVPGYGETATTGSSVFALNYASNTVTATRGELGVRWDRTIGAAGDAVYSLKARTAWAHDWNRDRAATATFQSLPGSAAFTVNGGTPAADSLLLSLGAGVRFSRGWSILATYEGEYSSNSVSNGGKGTIKYEW